MRQWGQRATLIVLACGLFWLFFKSTHPNLPSQHHPILFYSNQTRDDIKLIFATAFKKAEHSIHLQIYSLTDSGILKALTSAAKRGLSLCITYDPSASPQKPLTALKKHAPSLEAVQLHPIVISGLMHRKICVIDASMVFLGSANLTTASLRHHDNLVIGFYSPELAAFLRNPISTPFNFSIENIDAELCLLPESAPHALQRLLKALETAQTSIQIAMFTFTHPRLTDALIAAKARGVTVEIAIDHYTAGGASKKTIDRIEQAGISILVNRGAQLLHHKWALIDEKELITGSANWTEAAFKKNRDFLLFMKAPHPLLPIKTLWHSIALESFPRNPSNAKMK